MLKSPLEEEVVKLSNEVARLQIMVERCVHTNNKMYNNTQQQNSNTSPKTATTTTTTQQPQPQQPFSFSAPTDPLTALPTLFSGREGTARLFRVLVESYPWLLKPPTTTSFRKKRKC